MQTTEDFLRVLWPTEGRTAIVTIANKFVDHYWFEPDQHAAAAALTAKLCAQNIDVYFSTASFSGTERKAEQCIAVRTLFLDIDIGPEPTKNYPTRQDAITALQQFLGHTGLPTPIIVNSGYGYHCYWPFTTDLPYPEWKQMAVKLKSLCREHGFNTDLHCTADAARVLRPVGASNFKHGSAKRVRCVSQEEYTYADELLRTLLYDPNGTSFDFDTAATPGGGGSHVVEWGDTPANADFDEVLRRCATVRWVHENPGQVPEPVWYHALGVAGYCVDGEQNAHRISQGHPEYSRSATEAKLVQRMAFPPSTCAWFRANTTTCAGCPNTGTTPLVYGVPKNVTVSPPPIITANGSYFTHPTIKYDRAGLSVNSPIGKSADGEQAWDWIKVGSYGLRPLLELRQPDGAGNVSNYVWLEAYNLAKQSTNSFIVPSTGVVNSMQFANDCSKQGYYFEAETAPGAYKRYHAIMRTWIETMKQEQGAIVTFRSFGWIGADTANAKKNSFLLGTTLYNETGQHAAPLLPALAAYQNDMSASGSLDEWVKAMDNYNLPGMEGQMFATWVAWASPLMCFTSSGAIIFHIMGDTGVGKTSLQRSIISTYGSYNSKQLLDINTSTLNSVNKSLGIFNSLPYCKEELTEGDAGELAAWALTVTQGREKGRMTQSNGIAHAVTWNTIACTSANLSLREIIATNRQDNAARLARVWEQEIHLPIPQSEAMQLFRPLKHNYGLAGPIYIQYLVSNHDVIKQWVITTEDELAVRLKARGSDRFNISLLAACFVGVQIAKQLGLTNHDIERGMQFAVRQYKQLRQAAKAEQKTPEETLARFIQEVQPHTLVVEHDAPGTNTTAFDSDNNIIRSVSQNNPITMRYAKTTSMFYATVGIIRRYYADLHVNYETEMKQLEALGILKEWNKRVVLTKGTKLSDGKQTFCIWFDLSKSATLVEAVTEEA